MKPELEKLKKSMIEGGWGKLPIRAYPRPHLADWLKIEHPDIWEEYKKWFETEVFGK